MEPKQYCLVGEVGDDQLTAFQHDYSPVPLATFATVGTADRSFYYNKTASGKQPRVAGLLTLVSTGTKSLVWSILSVKIINVLCPTVHSSRDVISLGHIGLC
jgi:hypothetical protein